MTLRVIFETAALTTRLTALASAQAA